MGLAIDGELQAMVDSLEAVRQRDAFMGFFLARTAPAEGPTRKSRFQVGFKRLNRDSRRLTL